MRPPVSIRTVLSVGRNARRSSRRGLGLIRNVSIVSSLFVCVLFLSVAVRAQVAGSGSIQGAVVDPSGAAVPNATVTIQNPVSGYEQSVQSDRQGQFSFPNVPFNQYHVAVTAKGFAPYAQNVEVRSLVPVSVKAKLALAGTTTSVTVSSAPELIENTPVAHTDVSRQLFEKVPLESQSSSVSSLVTLTTPGVSADSNGLFHGMGDHASNSFSVDGQPITDQQSKVFSNQIPIASIQSLEVIEGAPPAEYGDKTSLVIVAQTRSGLGDTQPHGDVNASYGTFGSSNAGFTLGYGGQKWGNFISANGMNTSRFLDPPEFDVMHDKGNEENLFDRVDYRFTQSDTIHTALGYTRSWFQTPNSYDAQDASAWSGLVVDNGGLGPNGLPVGPQDQRSLINTFNIAPSWTHLLSTNTLFTLGGYVRQDRYHYIPSSNPFADLTPGLQLQTVGQNRRLTNAGAHLDLSYVKGIHNLKVGANYMQTFLTENDNFGIADPTFNPVCLNADGSPYTDPSLTNPSNCVGPLQPNPGFVPLLGCYDLTRTATLPASDGCPTSTSGLYNFDGHTDVKELALYAEDSITWKNWNFNLGLRQDFYNGITTARLTEPRLGAAYNIKGTGTVLRFSYARTLETPFNENLILASDGCNYPVINSLMSITQGYPCLTSPLAPGTRNEYHAGLEQAFGRYLVVSGEYIWKYTDGAYDFSVLGNTPITFPIEWDKSKIPGYAVRVSMPNYHGLTALVVFSSVAARFFEPQISGIGATPSGQGGNAVFRIDHDEKFNQTTHFQYQPWKNGPWLGFNWRYDSGLVAGAVPFATDTTTPVDLTGLTADQQLQAGLFCGSQVPTLSSPLTSCAPSQYGSTLITIPAPGTENDDHNPQRIAPRNLFDIALGDDNLFHDDRYKWSFRVSAINVTNKYALYNFLSTFSGTHYVTPRTITAQIGFHF
jgi:Carboxypeptidase regulatory-like domain/TonB-dependent Receptor Plug Domain